MERVAVLSGHTRHPGNCFRLFWNFTLRIITIRAARFVLEMGGLFLFPLPQGDS